MTGQFDADGVCSLRDDERSLLQVRPDRFVRGSGSTCPRRKAKGPVFLASVIFFPCGVYECERGREGGREVEKKSVC